MPKYEVMGSVTIDFIKEVYADDEQDAIDRVCNEVHSEYVEACDIDIAEVNEL